MRLFFAVFLGIFLCACEEEKSENQNLVKSSSRITKSCILMYNPQEINLDNLFNKTKNLKDYIEMKNYVTRLDNISDCTLQNCHK